MKKILSKALVLVLALSLLTACGNNSDSDNSDVKKSDAENSGVKDSKKDSTPPVTSDDDSDTTPTDSDSSEETTKPPASAELSTEWNSFQFELEGKIYTLPIRYSELEANGWVAQNDQDLEEKLEGGQYILNYITLVNSNKENSEISVQFANLDNEEMTLKECYVGGIQFEEYSWNKNTVLYFPGAFTIGSTKDEVDALYGQSNETNELSTTVESKYQVQNYDDVIFTFNKETGKIEKMRMSRLYLP